MRFVPFRACLPAHILAWTVWLCLLAAAGPASAAHGVADYLGAITASEILPGADRLGAPVGEPPLVPAYRGSETIGYVYLNTDFTTSVFR